jgi:hypothetical protein
MSNAIVLPALVLLSAGFMGDAAAYSQEEVNMFDDAASPTIYMENTPARPETDVSTESSGKYTHSANRSGSSGEAGLRKEKTSHH